LILAAVVLAMAGCSGSGDDLPREAVSGTVTLDSQPLADGTITFAPQAQGSTGGFATPGGAMIKDGKFYIAREVGMVPGTYSVAIYSAGKRGNGTKPAQPGGGGNKGTDVAPETIPAKYNSRTELKAEIQKGGSIDTLKFELKSK
jgi:hypothetical protein